MELKISDSDFLRLVEYMQSNFGINLRQKRTLVEGRLTNTIQQRGFKGFTDFLDMAFADNSGVETTNLLNKLTTNHTYFMREPEHYEFMRGELMPYLEEKKKNHSLYIWSAGCSSGEEPYTTQMELLEYFGRKTPHWDTKLLATDISENVLQRARKGVYHEDSMKNLPENYKSKYFSFVGNDCYQVSEELRKNVVFKAYNLMTPIPFRKQQFDLIFCRNVMIYFEMQTKIELINRFYEVLAPGGYLFIGHAESVPREVTRFKYVKPAIYRKPL